MLYIHQLKDLTPKSADIESTFIIRELKNKTPLPLTEEKIRDYFTLFFISESEKQAMAQASELIEPTINEILSLLHLKDSSYEAINLQRAINMLREIPVPLLNNINYAKVISVWQEDLVTEFTPLFNSLPQIKELSYEDRVLINQKLNEIFERLLRNNVIAFNYKDLIYEAQTSRINDLYESIQRGFLFHIGLEEELKKLDFEIIKRRIPAEKLQLAENINDQILQIKKGVSAAYDVNVRMMNWALVIYSYIKWLNK
jgi:hypothetical protein